jgi:hypothetical protein
MRLAVGRFVGIHRTFINAEFCKIEKHMLARSGVCMVVHRPHGPLALAEGMKKAARLLDVIGWDGPLWATMGTGNMAKFPVLDECRALRSSPTMTGQGATTGSPATTPRWRAPTAGGLLGGRRRPVEGLDWDDDLGTLRTSAKTEHCVEPGFDNRFDPDRETVGHFTR